MPMHALEKRTAARLLGGFSLGSLPVGVPLQQSLARLLPRVFPSWYTVAGPSFRSSALPKRSEYPRILKSVAMASRCVALAPLNQAAQ